MSWFIFSMIPASVSHVCKIFQNLPLRRKLSVYEIEFFLLKVWASHRFSSLFPFRGSGFAIYICLEGGVVILDELWAFMGIDIRVNLIHFPVFGDSEVNLAALLIYSEHMFADILNWWVLQRRWTVGIIIYVRVCYAPEK